MRNTLSLAGGLLMAFLITGRAEAQLVINGGSITLGDNAFITVQGDLISSSGDIGGTGKNYHERHCTAAVKHERFFHS